MRAIRRQTTWHKYCADTERKYSVRRSGTMIQVLNDIHSGRTYSGVGDNYILPGRRDHDRLRVISEIHDEQTRDLLLRAAFASGCHFVEFGCGLGYVTRWAAAMGADAVGIDVNEEQVEASRELAKAA